MLERASQRAFEQNDRKGSLTSPMVWSTAMVLPKTGGAPSVKISTRKRGWCVHVTAARCPRWPFKDLEGLKHVETTSAQEHHLQVAPCGLSRLREKWQWWTYTSQGLEELKATKRGPLEFSVLICVMKNFRINLTTKGSWVLSGNPPQMEHHGISPTSTPKKWWFRKEWPLTKEFGEFKVT